MDRPLGNKSTILASNYPLITKERSQQLELLRHLINNIARTIVICGPEGIGKTKMFELVRNQAPDNWLLCSITGNNQLSLEKIQQSITQLLEKKLPDFKFRSLGHALEKLGEQGMLLVLLLDDAGTLMPGLINDIISFADGKPALRCVLALTHSELFLKNNSDPAVENCYQIELPALSEKQCGEFLEYLSSLPKPRIHYSTINEERIASIYRDSHGIPGNIFSLLPESISFKKADYAKAILIVAVIGLVALALGIQWWSSHRQSVAEGLASHATADHEDKNAQASTAQGATLQATQLAKTQSQESITKTDAQNTSAAPTETINQPPPVGATQTTVTTTEPEIANQTKLSAEASADAVKNLAENTLPEMSDGLNQAQTADAWIRSEPAEHVTMQLMALSSEQEFQQAVERYKDLANKFRPVKTKSRHGKERIVVLFGSYSTPEEAAADKVQLPKELQKNWLRKIKDIQKELLNPPSTQDQAAQPDE